MTITLTVGATTLALDSDLQWSDQLSWSPVVQSVEHSITGALLIDESVKLAGRPITLQPPDPSSAWMPLATVSQLQAWAAQPCLVLTLNLRGTLISVMFRRTDGPPVEASPVTFVADPVPGGFGDDYLITIRLTEI